MMPAETVARPTVPPAEWPCGGECLVDNWPMPDTYRAGRPTVFWNCPEWDPDHDVPCSRHENHTGPHIHCHVGSADPNHHGLHEWPNQRKAA